MKKVLYISNIEVPYRTVFFNKLAKECDLTVLYERKKSANRDNFWTNSEKSNYNIKYLEGINIKDEFSFDFKIRKYIFSDYDFLIFGCINSPVQLYAITIMKLHKKRFYINLDGEYYIEGNSLKSKLKRFFLKGAIGYFVAGEKSCNKLKKLLNTNKVYSYYFSSLTEKELSNNKKNKNKNTNDIILIVGQYFDYKGLDVALKTARLMPKQTFKFIGMGKYSDDFVEKVKELKLKNVEVIPFLQKDYLYDEYRKCKMLVLPSRKESWGLVAIEAASFGTPIVSTYGSGAAVEFLSDEYPIFLANPNDSKDLYNKINKLINYKNIDNYKKYLLEKSKKYSIEHSVKVHIDVINKQ